MTHQDNGERKDKPTPPGDVVMPKTIAGWPVIKYVGNQLWLAKKDPDNKKKDTVIRVSGEQDLPVDVLIERARNLAQLEDQRQEDLAFALDKAMVETDAAKRVIALSNLLSGELTPQERQEIRDLLAFKPTERG